LGLAGLKSTKEIHFFAASDKHHPFCGRFHLLLVELDEHLRLAGYVPDWDLFFVGFWHSSS